MADFVKKCIIFVILGQIGKRPLFLAPITAVRRRSHALIEFKIFIEMVHTGIAGLPCRVLNTHSRAQKPCCFSNADFVDIGNRRSIKILSEQVGQMTGSTAGHLRQTVQRQGFRVVKIDIVNRPVQSLIVCKIPSNSFSCWTSMGLAIISQAPRRSARCA